MLPQVRVYSEEEIGNLLGRGEFNIAVTASSRQRRSSYMVEAIREKERESFEGDYETFLRSCGMRMRLFVPRGEQEVMRCLELIQRANQLNLSNTRYTADEFRALLSREGILCLAMECEDRFGAYGIVGFARVDEQEDRSVLRDLVLSCRVAQKRVEHAFLRWLVLRERSRAKGVAVEMVETERNQPIRQVFVDLRFRTSGERDGRVRMEFPDDADVASDRIVSIEVSAELRTDEELGILNPFLTPVMSEKS